MPRIYRTFDAIVIGAGPNGLAAAITLALAGRSVLVIEASESIGGGASSAELTLPGFVHDVCSAVHPMAAGSPVFAQWPLHDHGLLWIHPSIPLAHPLDDGTAAVLQRSIADTCRGLGRDGNAYRRLIEPLTRNFDSLVSDLLGPPKTPRHPIASLRFSWWAARSARGVVESWFREEPARALFAGLAAHSFLPMEMAPSAAIGLVLATAGHAVGWPIPRGGSQNIANALASYFCSLGGEIRTGWRVQSLDELPRAGAILCDVAPRTLPKLAGSTLSGLYGRALRRFRYGPAAFKLDWALREPIPWTARECREAGTVHVGGTFGMIAAAERAMWGGRPPEAPFVLVAQPTLCDPSRAPPGKHVAWAYAHVPHGCSQDFTERIEAQIERFAPGFRDVILARSVMTPADLELRNPNLVGGAITGGIPSLWQTIARPALRWNPYSTPVRGLYLCSASTPPGAGVHGLCGYHAAQSVLRSAQ
jgi:phytoene dehydrogenase-like protein